MIFAGLVVLAALAEGFSVGAVNCGAFHYGDTNVSASAYAGEWKRLAAENPADVFFYEDVGRGTDLPGEVAVPGLDIRASVRTKPLATDVIDLPKAIDVGGVERRTPRYRALRLTYPFAGGKLAVYGVHLVAEGHIRGPKPEKGGLSASQRLRRRQFGALIADARNFDYAILCGDFNAQNASEYGAFEAAGFVIGNCSKGFGVQATLRNLPADNIILSPSLAFDGFRVLKNYRLNTDHCPLVAQIQRADKDEAENSALPLDVLSVADYLELPSAERRRLFADEGFRRTMQAAGYPEGEGLLSRWTRIDRIPNMRDVGGVTNRFGQVLRRGVFYRSAGWNDNAKCPKERPKEEWTVGKTRLTACGREQVAKLGLRTDLDLRSAKECWGMTGSPVGNDVCWTNIPFGHYDEFKKKPRFKKAVGLAFDILADATRTPLVFHCIGGADRTGCLAFLVQGLCGVAEEDLVKDWELTGCYTARLNFTHEKCIDRFLEMLMDYPGETIEQRIRAFLHDCGVADRQIEAVRKALLPNDACDAPQWPEVTQTAKPWVYNWWMASAVDEKGLENQCAELEAAGFGGFHVIPIYGAKGYEAEYRTLLSPEWVEAWNLAVRTARKHGLGVDLTMGSGWCFGGPWVTEADAASSGMKVKRAGPGGQGYMIDPFSPQAMSNHVAKFEAAFGKNGTAERPRAFYHDSFEYFEARPKKGGEVTDLVLKTFSVWTDWCRENGYLTRNEAHGSPVNWLDFYAIADIPETEMFGPNCRDILISKFASSAAHVTGKRLVSSESCTWIGQHFGVPLAEYKRFIDRLFLSGVNHVFYHGCCYSPVEAPWPGWCFYASSEMNWRNPIWRDVKFLNAYIARCQAMFQSCEPDEDTLVYWPFDDYPVGTNGVIASLTVHNASAWFHSHPIGEAVERLSREGRAFDYVSDRQLQSVDLARYADLVVPPCTNMPAATRTAIGRFVRRPVRTEPFPEAGLCFTRMRRGDETVYFLANTNATKVVSTAQPSAQGAMWWMDPMTGEIAPLNGPVELEAYGSGFLVVKGKGPRSRSLTGGVDAGRASPIAGAIAPLLSLPGPWTLTPVCGGPVLPSVRTMEALSTWSRTADGSENPFSGTMCYTTMFVLPSSPSPSTCTLDLGRVEQSARIRINGKDVGFAIMAPYRVRFDASVLKVGRNEIEIEVTSVGQNRLRRLGKEGVKWAYFEDINMMDFRNLGKPGAGEMGFDTATLSLCDCGLFGPVEIYLRN